MEKREPRKVGNPGMLHDDGAAITALVCCLGLISGYFLLIIAKWIHMEVVYIFCRAIGKLFVLFYCILFVSFFPRPCRSVD